MATMQSGWTFSGSSRLAAASFAFLFALCLGLNELAKAEDLDVSALQKKLAERERELSAPANVSRYHGDTSDPFYKELYGGAYLRSLLLYKEGYFPQKVSKRNKPKSSGRQEPPGRLPYEFSGFILPLWESPHLESVFPDFGWKYFD